MSRALNKAKTWFSSNNTQMLILSVAIAVTGIAMVLQVYTNLAKEPVDMIQQSYDNIRAEEQERTEWTANVAKYIDESKFAQTADTFEVAGKQFKVDFKDVKGGFYDIYKTGSDSWWICFSNNTDKGSMKLAEVYIGGKPNKLLEFESIGKAGLKDIVLSKDSPVSIEVLK